MSGITGDAILHELAPKDDLERAGEFVVVGDWLLDTRATVSNDPSRNRAEQIGRCRSGRRLPEQERKRREPMASRAFETETSDLESFYDPRSIAIIGSSGHPRKSGGRPPADREAIVDAILRVLRLVTDHRDGISELDVNPLVVFSKGARAVDALIRGCGVRAPGPASVPAVGRG
jgi:hypothetical protein